jgi:DNA primase
LSPADVTKQIKTANDIVDVIASYLGPVHSAGKLFKCICPFHQDTRPSLQIDRHWQNYHCWACGAKGDVITFVEKYEKVGFKEARAILARRAGIKLESEPAADDPKQQLFEVMRWAQQVYQQCYLESDEAAEARQYMGGRRLAGPTVRQFGIGFAPLDGEWLVRKARQDGHDPARLVAAGLLAARDEGQGHYDRFRDRVMFPIRDTQGRTVAFGGRILPTSPYADRGPKYYNSPDTALFHKSSVIFGLDVARHAGTKDGFLAVVEGYTDVMMAHQCGVANVVATMGTALTAGHVAQLRRYAPKVVLVYDADAGGQTGVDRALELFISQDVELAVASLPDGLDPCDLLARTDGIDVFRQCLASATDALNFKLNQMVSQPSAASVEGSRRVVDAVLGVMALAPDIPNQAAQLKQQLIITRLAQRVGVRQESVWARLRELRAGRHGAARRETGPSAGNPDLPKTAGKPPIIESQLLQVLLAEPELVSDARTRIATGELIHTGLRRILDELYMLSEIGQPADMDGLRVRLIENDRSDLVEAAMTLQAIGRHVTDRSIYYNKIVAGFAHRRAEAERRQVKSELSAAADDAAQLALLRKLQDRGRPPAA